VVARFLVYPAKVDFRWLREELKASDVDFYITSAELEKKFNSYFTNRGVLKPENLEMIDPKLYEVFKEFSKETSEQIGRSANIRLIRREVIEKSSKNEFVTLRQS
jgi:hypothetical protein